MFQQQLFLQFQKSLYTKSFAEKIVNDFYNIINHLTVEWFNSDAKTLVNQIESDENLNFGQKLIDVIEQFRVKISQIDCNAMIEESHNRTRAGVQDNVIYIINETSFKIIEGICDKHEWDRKFVKFINQVSDAIYCGFKGTDVDKVVKLYFSNNLNDLYLKHIMDYKGKSNANKKVIKLINVNDVIDLLSLCYAQSKGLIFITNDAGINRVISKIYTKEQKKIVNLFINYKFEENNKDV